jgi:hypothetical protein
MTTARELADEGRRRGLTGAALRRYVDDQRLRLTGRPASDYLIERAVDSGSSTSGGAA